MDRQRGPSSFFARDSGLLGTPWNASGGLGWPQLGPGFRKSLIADEIALVRWAPGVLFGVLDAPKTRAAQAVLDVQ